ncbi:uncharacterized protein BROUX77_002946 [Berkeleyomyces rouxiae]|uniref:uncharacterized protein n=1 Tax=Berkeleyomyces rouxiae TaxID=2035830 RepID=UPI003B7FAEB7
MVCKHPRVAYLGPPGTYTHQAAAKIFNTNSYSVDHTELISDVFSRVASGEALYGVVPISNSTRGLVHATLAAFMGVDQRYLNVRICGEIYVRVNHCLMGHKAAAGSAGAGTSAGASNVDTATTAAAVMYTSASGTSTPTPSKPNPERPRSHPLASLKHITKVYSHEQALSQCSIFLDAYLRHAERIEVSSTSRAAELAFTDEKGTSAAISSVMAADIYNLDILARSIQNAATNATGFYILRKAMGDDAFAQIPQDIPNPANTTKWKGFAHFVVDEDKPENLGRIIQTFVTNGAHVVEIHSQPREGNPFCLDYFITIETGLPMETDSTIENTVQKASRLAESFQWLGYWPKMDWKTSS